jgi:hypothetical protein
MTVTLDLKPEIEQGPLAQARAASPAAGSGKALKLTVPHLRAMSSLHRRDICDDVR